MLRLAFNHIEAGLLATGWNAREIVRRERDGQELPRAPVAYLSPALEPGDLERRPARTRLTDTAVERQLWQGTHGVRLIVQHTTPERLETSVRALLVWLFDHRVSGNDQGSRVVFTDKTQVGFFDDTGQYVGESGVVLDLVANITVTRGFALVERSPEIEDAGFET